MKILAPLTALIFIFGAGIPEPMFAQRTVVIKLASLIPENTPWGSALKRMSAEFSRITNGTVELRVYHSGVVGGEEDTLRKLKSNQIQAAVFSTFGINLIIPEVMTLSVPFFIKNDGELDAVLAEVEAELEAKIVSEGFFPLAWAKSGWVRLFSKTPVFVPADLKRLKLATGPEAPSLAQAFKTMGFQMVPTNQTDTLVFLSSGRIEALYNSPMSIAASQMFAITKNMMALNIAPFMGAIIINRTAWRAIPEQYKPQLLSMIETIEKDISSSVSELETEAIRTMATYGLTVNHLTPAQEQLWIDEVNRAMPSLIGTTFNRTLYEKINNILIQYRNNH
ncbi:MAG: TRAP transporter substrate-binding protein DctP [Treponema sp.]|jgi:TRAP-type C4-dicarboxylate transport system substrate-binding protein|nr:TRAP transporter substrate-binding protein DctP [Treponema sp.]